MISAGLVAAVCTLGLIVLMTVSGFACVRGPKMADRLAPGIALWLQSIVLAAVCGLWAGAGAAAMIAAGAVFFAGLLALVAVIKLVRHRSLATALARPSGPVGSSRP